jgi:hypothetical protein
MACGAWCVLKNLDNIADTNFSNTIEPKEPRRVVIMVVMSARVVVQSKVHKFPPLYNFVNFLNFLKNSLTDLPRILRRIQIRSQNKQGVNT